MRIHTAVAALLLTTSLLPVAALAEDAAPARVRLLVVDETSAVLAAAMVTIYTLDGRPGVTVTTDQKGVAVFPDLAVGMAEIVARFPGHAPYAETATLRSGDNAQTVTLPSRKGATDTTSSADTSG